MTPDRFATARSVADAVLYEGYVLYPYRASAPKNQIRWQFGVLAPRSFSEADASERWSMGTECIVDPGQTPVLTVRLRFLQIQRRSIEAATAAGTFEETGNLHLDGAVYVPWDEAVEQAIDLEPLVLLPLAAAAQELTFDLPASEETEILHAGDGSVRGRVSRRRDAVEGRVTTTSEWAAGPGALLKVTVKVDNATTWSDATARRDDVLSRSLVAVHTMLAIDDGTFVSLLDPPDEAREAVAACVNEGTFPVLIGGDDVVLSSPIILYDHPEVAPESPGDLYDSTEIDEILALRILTLTDEEKAEARGTDPRAAAIIDRCEDMPPELWERLHGAVRALRPSEAVAEPQPLPWWDADVDATFDPWTDQLLISGVEVGQGTKVVLRPSRRSDAHDFFLAGLEATVAGVFRDVDGEAHLAVTVDSDPATEALEWQGRYLFFYPDEVELTTESQAAS